VCFVSGRRTVRNIHNQLDTIFIVDTFYYEVDNPIPVYVVKRDTIYIYDTINFPTPSTPEEVLVDFSNTYVYQDTVEFEDFGFTIEEHVSENRLTHREVEATYQKQVIELTGLFLGADISKNTFTPEISYVRKGWEYSLGYQFGFDFPNSISIGLKKRLWKPSTK
jgi:hypothetical protein